MLHTPTYNFFDYTLIPCSLLEDQSFSTGLEAFFSDKFTIFLSDIEKATFPLLSWFLLWFDYFKNKTQPFFNKTASKKYSIQQDVLSEH